MKNKVLIILLIFSVFAVNAQESGRKSRKERKAEKNAIQKEKISNLVEDKNFVFVPRTANPLSGTTVNLTTDFDLWFHNDSVNSYMPFYGRAYIAAYGGENPMNFISSVDDYSSEKTRKGYEVNFTVKNESDRLDFSFHIMETGLTTLQVNSTNRQSISYYGVLEEKESEKK